MNLRILSVFMQWHFIQAGAMIGQKYDRLMTTA